MSLKEHCQETKYEYIPDQCSTTSQFNNNRPVSHRIHRLRSAMANSTARYLPPLKQIFPAPRGENPPIQTSGRTSKQLRLGKEKIESRLQPEPIFEEFFVIGIDLSKLNIDDVGEGVETRQYYTPTILFRYESHQCLTLDPVQVLSFVCPSGQIKIRAGPQSDHVLGNDFVFTAQLTTNDKGLVQMFGICMIQSELITIIEPRSGRCLRLMIDMRYCMTTRHPVLDYHFSLVQNLIAAQQRHRLGHHSIQIAGPNLNRSMTNEWQSGGCLRLLHQLSHGQQLEMESDLDLRPIRSWNHSVSIVSWAARKVLRRVSAKNLITLIDAVLREMSIVIVGTDLSETSAWVLYLTSVIHPLIWVGIVLPVLPDSWHDFLQSPVPIIAAVRHLPDLVQYQTNMVIWRPDSNQISIGQAETEMPEAASRCQQGLEAELESLRYEERRPDDDDQQIMDGIYEIIGDYVKDVIKRSRCDPDYFPYQWTQIMTYYYTNIEE